MGFNTIICARSLLLLGLFSYGICDTDEEQKTRIDAFVREIMTNNDVPGLSLAVVKRGDPFMSEGYGVMDLQSQRPITNQTLFYIASTTKAMTATVLAKVLHEGSR